MVKAFLLGLLVLSCSSCINFGKTYKPLRTTTTWNAFDYGLIIGACTERNERGSLHESYCRLAMESDRYHGVQIGATSLLQLDDDSYVVDKNENIRRRLFIFQVPPGLWSFRGWGVSGRKPNWYYTNNKYWIEYVVKDAYKNIASVQIKKGETVYIGDIQLTHIYVKRTLPIYEDIEEPDDESKPFLAFAGAIPIIKDNIQDDIRLLTKRYRFLRNTNVINRTIKIDRELLKSIKPVR